MNVQELEGAELDAAVAKVLGYVHHGAVGLFERNDSRPWCLSEVNDWWKDPEGRWICGPCTGFPYNYSTEWERGGPIIERERITLMHVGGADGFWNAGYEPEVDEGSQCESGWIDLPAVTMTHECSGPTPLIAAMRAYVASKEPA